MLSERIEIRLSTSQAARIRAAAEAGHQSMSDWIRSVLMARLTDASADEGRERRLSALHEIFDLDLPVDDWQVEKERLNRRFDESRP